MGQITIKEIAEICGVSVSTVSRAINNHPAINEDTRKKVIDTIQKYHYIPNNSARNLKRAESSTIAVLVKGISNPFFGSMIEVLEREIISRRYTFCLQQVDEQENEVKAAIELEKEKRLKGVLFLGGLHQHPSEQLQGLTVPGVTLTAPMHRREEEPALGMVSIDDEAESFRMTEYLCQSGFKRIAIITPDREDESVGAARLAGYRRALAACGIEEDPTLILFTERDAHTYTIRRGYEVTAKMLREMPEEKRPDCIYCVADTIAVGACRAVFDAGLQVPGDIAVAGFDGSEMAEFYYPTITTMRQPREEMARQAARLLFEMIEEQHPQKKRLIFNAELHEGESTRR